MFVLVGKVLRDLRTSLLVTCSLLFAFQLLWAKVAFRITTQILTKFLGQGVTIEFIRETLFQDTGQIVQALMGGDNIKIERVFDMMSISYVHPLTQTILCIWAIGRASGAIAGEIDRGTMELLLAQPIRRSQVILAHLIVDGCTMPVLGLSMWSGTWLGLWLVGLIDHPDAYLRVDPWRFGPAMINVGALLFAVSGVTMWLSAAGRYRYRVLGLAVLLALVQFLLNVVGQLWDAIAWVRPWTVFYYYQPQPMILRTNWADSPEVWLRLGVLVGVGAAGYGLAMGTFCRRDLPAPL